MTTVVPATEPSGASATGPDSGRVELVIGGMTCASCAARIEKKLNRLDGVTATRQLRHREGDGPRTPDGVTPERAGRRRRASRLHRRRCRPPPRRRCRAATSAGRRPTAARAARPAAGLRRADRAGGRAGDGPGAAVHLLAVAVADAGRAGGGVGRAGRSTGPPGSNLRHGAATMDTLISIGVLAAFGWSLYALFLGTAGDAGMTHPFELTIARHGRRRQHLPGGRRRGHHVHPGRPVLRGAGQAPGRRGAAGAAGAGRQGRRGAARTAPRARVAGRPARGRRPVRGAPGGEDRHRRRGRGGHLRGGRSMLTGESVPVEVGPGDAVVGGDGQRRRPAGRAGHPGRRGHPAGPDGAAGRGGADRQGRRCSGWPTGSPAVFVPVVIVLAVGHARLLARHRRRRRRPRSPPRSRC